MKAIVIQSYISDYTDIQASNVPEPTIKTTSDVLVSITYAGLNHVDLLYARGKHQNNHAGLVKPPFILGLEFTGVVARTGSVVSKWKVGDLVFGLCSSGAFAERIVVSESALYRVPGGWTQEEAASLGAATIPVAYGALVRLSELKAGETVLVHAGAGGLGVAAVQVARAAGARVVATVGSEPKRKWLRDVLEVENVVLYGQDGWEKEVLGYTTEGNGVDVVFDTVGLVEKSIRCVRFGGTVVVAGFAGLDGKMERVAMNRVLLKNAKVLGYRFGESGRRDPEEHARIWRGLKEMIRKGRIRPVHCKSYVGLQSVAEAMGDLADRKVCGKAVIEVGEGGRTRPKI